MSTTRKKFNEIREVRGGGERKFNPLPPAIRKPGAYLAALFLLLTLTFFLLDAALSVLVGLDSAHKGPDRPVAQLTVSVVLTVGYLTLAIITMGALRAEGKPNRLGRGWDLVSGLSWANMVNAVLAGVTALVFLFWMVWHPGKVSGGITSDGGTAFVTWIAANALAVGTFLLRFMSFAVAWGHQRLLYRVRRVTSGGVRFAEDV